MFFLLKFTWFDGSNINDGFMLPKLATDFNKLCKFNSKQGYNY